MDDGRRRRRPRRLTLKTSATSSAALAALAVFLAAQTVSAQTFDAVGVRAQGMGGAFVAVADDATATWWNPAGLGSRVVLDMALEYVQVDDAPTNPLSEGFAFGYPALGLSYYRLPVNQFRLLTPTGGTLTSREDQGVLNQYGVSVGQSIGQHFVIASTVKLLRAADSKLEFDAAAMFSYGILRVGATVRNLRQASLTTDAGNLLQLERQTRVGAAVTGSTKGEIETATASFDVDLRTTHTFWGEERRVAGGGEIWTKGRKFGFRGGLSANTVDDTTARSAGVSVALHRGVYLEGQLTGGSDISRKGWGSGLRLTF